MGHKGRRSTTEQSRTVTRPACPLLAQQQRAARENNKKHSRTCGPPLPEVPFVTRFLAASTSRRMAPGRRCTTSDTRRPSAVAMWPSSSAQTDRHHCRVHSHVQVGGGLTVPYSRCVRCESGKGRQSPRAMIAMDEGYEGTTGRELSNRERQIV